MDTKPRISLDIFNDIRSLPEEEQFAIARKLMSVLSSPRGETSYLGDVVVSEFDGDVIVCPHCGSDHVIKKGYANDHITRRYKCMDCGKGFRKTTNSVISFTHKSTDVWERFILMTLRKETLEACTKECGISIATAFSWRHKIMAALADDQSERKLTGIIEMDETFTRISYKGNHKKSKDFKMPRPAYSVSLHFYSSIFKETLPCLAAHK